MNLSLKRERIVLKLWGAGIITQFDDVSTRMTYTNTAVNPDGTLRPWRTGKTSYHPPVLRFDGQILYLQRKW